MRNVGVSMNKNHYNGCYVGFFMLVPWVWDLAFGALGLSLVMWALLGVGFVGIWKRGNLEVCREVCSKSSTQCKDSPLVIVVCISPCFFDMWSLVKREVTWM